MALAIAALVKQIPMFEAMELGSDGRLRARRARARDEPLLPARGRPGSRARGRPRRYRVRDHARPTGGGGRPARGDRVGARAWGRDDGRARVRSGIRGIGHAGNGNRARGRGPVGGSLRSRARRPQLGGCRHRPGRTRARRAARRGVRDRSAASLARTRGPRPAVRARRRLGASADGASRRPLDRRAPDRPVQGRPRGPRRGPGRPDPRSHGTRHRRRAVGPGREPDPRRAGARHRIRAAAPSPARCAARRAGTPRDRDPRRTRCARSRYGPRRRPR